MKQRILFLCTGNYYRSRFAELLFNHHAEIAQHPWRAFSRGLAIELLEKDAGPISPHALEGLAARGVGLNQAIREPAAVSEEDLQIADRIVALKKAEHLPLLLKKYPGWIARVEFWHVHDIDQAIPEIALSQIEVEVLRLLRSLVSNEPLGRHGNA